MDEGVLTPRQYAESAANNARAIYEDRGRVEPMLMLIGESGESILQIKLSEDIPAAMGRTLYATVAVLQPHTVVTVAETWMKRFNPEDAPMKDGEPHLERGQLQRMHEGGDETIKTNLMTIAWRLDESETITIGDMVLTEEPLAFEREVFEGAQTGNFYDCVYGGWRGGLGLKPPEDVDRDTLARLLAIIGDVVGGLMATPIKDDEESSDV